MENWFKGIGQTLGKNLSFPQQLFPATPIAMDKSDKHISDDLELFVRNLRVSYESDLEIKFQVPRRQAKTYNWASLGFRSETAKAWKMLINILQNSDHSFNIGPAHIESAGITTRVKNYDRQLKLLKQINTKLIKFINSTFGLQISEDFKIYELRKSDKPGTYGFKFQVGEDTLDGNRTKYELLSKENLILLAKRCYEKSKESNLSKEEELDQLYAIEVLKRKWKMPAEELKDIIFSDEQPQEIYDPYENKGDSD